MVRPRFNHSSTALGDKIFVVGGYAGPDLMYAYIEVFDTRSPSPIWVEISGVIAEGLISPAVAPINSNLILIAGGKVRGSEIDEFCIVDTRSH